MIYTVTFNPSLDYIVSVDSFQLGMTNRTTFEQILPGGKGINVSIVLRNLGLETTALAVWKQQHLDLSQASPEKKSAGVWRRSAAGRSSSGLHPVSHAST